MTEFHVPISDPLIASQVHAVMMERNNTLASGGIGYTTAGLSDSSTIRYFNQSPPPITNFNIPATTMVRRAETKL
jgi:hypothetical protein